MENAQKKGTPTIKDGRSEPNPDKVYWWTMRIGVSATWVADGFDLDDDRAHDMLSHHLPHAFGHELHAEVLHAPDPREVAGEQGFNTVEEANIGKVDYSPRRRAIARRAANVTETFMRSLPYSTNDATRQRLRNMIELALCEETGVPWDAPLRKRKKK